MQAQTPGNPLSDAVSGPLVIEAERVAGGLMITFDDGEFAFYPPGLLYQNLQYAHRPAVLEDD